MKIKTVTFSGSDMRVSFDTGETIAVPLSFFPQLAVASPDQRQQFELIGRGIGVTWEALDVDLSVENILNAHSRVKLLAYAS